MRFFRASLIVLVALVVGTGSAAAGNIYVDDSNTTSPWLGTLTDPYQTITQALVVGMPVSGDAILVLPGTYPTAYGGAAGETWPLSIPSGVDVRAYDPNDKPRIGGDTHLNPPPTTRWGIFEIDATASDRTGTEIENFQFLAENYTNYDGPSALLVKVDGTKTISGCGFNYNVVERSAMNDSSAGDQAAIFAICGNGSLGDGTASFQLVRNTIYAPARGGIEIKTGNTGTGSAYMNLNVRGNTISVSGSNNATFGIRLGGDNGAAADIQPNIEGNTIDSTGATSGYGIQTGIDLFATGLNGKAVKFATIASVHIIKNVIKGCLGDGFRLKMGTDTNGSSYAYFATGDFQRNDIRLNGGAGIHADFGDWSTGEGAGRYIHIDTQGNVIVKNQIGVWYHNFKVNASLGGSSALSDTIAHNTSYGYQFDNYQSGQPLTNEPGRFENMIVYGNAGTNQVGGNTSPAWAPGNKVSFSDWTGVGSSCTPDGFGNISCDPAFVSVAGGNFHLGSSSPCIDKGDNTPDGSLPAVDIDGDDRIIDGDSVPGAVIDMGADEYKP